MLEQLPMPADQKIDYLEFPASDFEATKTFYRTVFDWEFTDYGPDYCSFEDGKLTGGFYKSELRSTTEGGAVLVVLYATKLEDTLERVLAAGGKEQKPIFSFPGGRRFHFLDPHGNELAVWSDS